MAKLIYLGLAAKKNRVVTASLEKGFSEGDFLYQNHLLDVIDSLDETHQKKLLTQQIQVKINGYRSQDIHKQLFDPEAFVSFDWVRQKLRASDLLCFYCQKPILLLYKQSRDPLQWSLERIENSRGHNRDNVEIACLRCNVRRRCMYHERFRFTKQTVFVKQL